ncbi:MAG TPA: M24 family metallopeptidase [Steroidobacteraceae bacterium]|jgi:Xaa-Pro aminopeptidase|nr:M24 family metallopeptidase [Steroidobacteraceae bacterium]
MDTTATELFSAQIKAEALFAEIVACGMVCPGKLESELTAEIHALAQARFGVRRHWHKRIARSGPNTLLTYHDPHSDRRIGNDDIVYLDLGPVFEAWEADFGRTYVVGSDPDKHRLVGDLADAFSRGKNFYRQSPNLTAGQLYDYTAALAADYGWEFGARTAGHVIGLFPHETRPQDPDHLRIRHGNPLPLREPGANGQRRHWILEIHFVDRARQIGGFFEELLTVDGPG